MFFLKNSTHSSHIQSTKQARCILFDNKLLLATGITSLNTFSTKIECFYSLVIIQPKDPCPIQSPPSPHTKFVDTVKSYSENCVHSINLKREAEVQMYISTWNKTDVVPISTSRAGYWQMRPINRSLYTHLWDNKKCPVLSTSSCSNFIRKRQLRVAARLQNPAQKWVHVWQIHSSTAASYEKWHSQHTRAFLF